MSAFIFTDSVLDNPSSQDHSDDDKQQSPALVIYVVEPFTFGQFDSDLYRLVTLGLLYSYADMLASLPESIKNSINVQVFTIHTFFSLCYIHCLNFFKNFIIHNLN